MRLRIYEAVFLTTGAGAFLALCVKGGGHWAVRAEVLAGTLLYLGGFVYLPWAEGPCRERLTLCANYLFAVWFYGASSRITAALGCVTIDGSLLAFDRKLFGETPAVMFAHWAQPWLSDIMGFCYLSYLVYLHVAVIWAVFRAPEDIRRFSSALFPGFAVGFAAYLLLPALGPGAAFPGLFAAPIAVGALTRLNDFVVGTSNAIYGTFPSLHLLITLLLMDHDWRECRIRFWWMLGPAAGLVLSTMYLRYHYATDLLAGLIVFYLLKTAHLRWKTYL